MSDKTDMRDKIDYSKYGITDINSVGYRPRSAWVIAEPDKEWPYVPVGSLCVKTRDGALTPVCVEALKHPNCFDTIEDSFDSTYRYYFFRPMDADMQGDAARLLGASGDLTSVQNSEGTLTRLAPDKWLCATCNREVDPCDVTYDERHDTRSGGCGSVVSSTNVVEKERNRCIKILLDAGEYESRDTIAERMRG